MSDQQLKPAQVMALAVGGILAGWEIDPGWNPQPGDTVRVGFESLASVRVPAAQCIALTTFQILVADGMRAGGKGLAQRVDTAVKRASESVTDKKGTI